jgi:hypothetical protein
VSWHLIIIENASGFVLSVFGETQAIARRRYLGDNLQALNLNAPYTIGSKLNAARWAPVYGALIISRRRAQRSMGH